jgi:hypothetical protein
MTVGSRRCSSCLVFSRIERGGLQIMTEKPARREPNASSRVDREREGRPWYRLRWFSVLGLLILLPGLCCFVSYQLPILNDFYFLAFGRHYYDQVIALIPEFDRLKDGLMARVPLDLARRSGRTGSWCTAINRRSPQTQVWVCCVDGISAEFRLCCSLSLA